MRGLTLLARLAGEFSSWLSIYHSFRLMHYKIASDINVDSHLDDDIHDHIMWVLWYDCPELMFLKFV